MTKALKLYAPFRIMMLFAFVAIGVHTKSYAQGDCPGHYFPGNTAKAIYSLEEISVNIKDSIYRYLVSRVGQDNHSLFKFSSLFEVDSIALIQHEPSMSDFFKNNPFQKYYVGFRYTDTISGFNRECVYLCLNKFGELTTDLNLPDFVRYPERRFVKISEEKSLIIAEDVMLKYDNEEEGSRQLYGGQLMYLEDCQCFTWRWERQINQEEYEALFIDAVSGDFVYSYIFSDL